MPHRNGSEVQRIDGGIVLEGINESDLIQSLDDSGYEMRTDQSLPTGGAGLSHAAHAVETEQSHRVNRGIVRGVEFHNRFG